MSDASTVTTFPSDFNRDPFPLLRDLRESGPVVQVSLPDGLGITRWLITRYDDAVAALGDPRLSNGIDAPLRDIDDPASLPPRVQVLLRTSELLGRAMANMDPPGHTRLRKLAVPAFNARRMEGLRPRVRQITGELLGTVAGRPEFDLVETLAMPLPVRVVCELLGVPARDGQVFRDASKVLAGYLPDDETALASIRDLDAFEKHIRALIAERRARPADDLLSDLIQARADGRRLTDEELVAMAGLLIFAGHETTVQMICNAMIALLGDPDQLAAVRADHGLLPAVVEETLRFDGPANPGLMRYATEDVEIGGVLIPRGACVIVATAAANRDPRVFRDPDRFDITRAFPAPHLAFGHGIHYCLGARMAKIEGEIAIGALLDRYPGLRLGCAVEELRWRPGLLRATVELPLQAGPSQKGSAHE
ncbi:cytochrome P450 [Spongiactinospora sp. 9N601]|uniref:cytochrome P450 n=1 Tax=Spongiactinospora sp. 9N601 TaxID=3375149 RepID=UPI0037A3E765